jgi:hypothetical protein
VVSSQAAVSLLWSHTHPSPFQRSAMPCCGHVAADNSWIGSDGALGLAAFHLLCTLAFMTDEQECPVFCSSLRVPPVLPKPLLLPRPI